MAHAPIWLITSAALAMAPYGARAQDADALARVAATITAAELGRHVAVLAADSMHGRPTPSPALEQTAAYVAAEFQRLGLRPGVPDKERGRDSTWFQRYPLPGQQRFDYATSRLACLQPNQPNVFTEFTQEAHFLPAVAPPVVVENVLNGGTTYLTSDWVRMGSERVVLVSGRQTAASLAQARAALADVVALYVRAPGVDSAAEAQTLAALYAASAGVVVLRATASAADSARFAAALRAARQVPVTVVDGYLRGATGPRRWPWAAAVRADVFAPCLTTRGFDLAAVQADTIPRVQPVPRTAVWLSPHVDPVAASAAGTAPNVLGWLEGTDSLLQRELVVVSAHMDGHGRGPSDPTHPSDTTAPKAANDADDNAVGVAALLALARALSDPAVRPPRSVLFVATSGTGPGQAFWGSEVAASYDQRLGFLAQGRTLVANLTLERLGRLRGDSVLIHGIEDFDGAPRADWLAAAHPELGLQVVDASTAVTPLGDQRAFVRHNVPSLYVHAGEHGAAAGAAAGEAGRATALDFDAAARVVRFVFYLTREFAAAPQTPRWSAAGRERFLSLQPAP